MNENAFHNHPLSQPLFVLLCITLPQALLIWLTAQSYNVIHTLLNDEQRQLWWQFGGSLTGLLLGISAYALWRWFHKKPVSIWLAPLLLLLYGSYLYLYFKNINMLFPSSIPNWMINQDNLFRYPGAFIVPALAYATFLGVLWFTPKQPEKWLALKSFTASALIPTFWYLFFTLISPLFRHVNARFLTHALTILVLISTLIFLLFLIRGVYLLMRHRQPSHLLQYFWLTIFTLVLPITGLLLNSGSTGLFYGNHLFGDFSHPAFLTLCILNGLCLLLPERSNPAQNLALYVARSITFAFTVYFFLVFMPFLPMSVFAIIIFGTGVLMLAPIVLMVIHSRLLHQHFQQLTEHYTRPLLWAISLAAVLVLPTAITLQFLHDRSTLHSALQRVYEPDYFTSTTDEIDLGALDTVLRKLKGDKQHRRGDGLFSSDTPFLSSYYQWLVLDNLTLSNKKIARLDQLFFHTSDRPYERTPLTFVDAELEAVTSHSEYHDAGAYWQSTVNIRLHNPHDSMAEYRSHLALPEGTWVTGYALEIEDKMVPGVLVEKKAAQWVYNNIRSQRRDPGLVYYQADGNLSLRVFPFNAEQTRRISLTLTHKHPIHLTLDTHSIDLGDHTQPPSPIVHTARSVFIPSTLAATLPTRQRKPYVHFILDMSQTSAEQQPNYADQIRAFIDTHSVTPTDSKITLADFGRRTYAYIDDWPNAIRDSHAQGGLFLDAAIRSVLLNSYHTDATHYPVIVVLSPHIEQAILPAHLNDIAFSFLEQDRYFVLDEHNRLRAKALTNNQALPAQQLLTQQPPLSIWQQGQHSAYLVARGEDSIAPLRQASLAPWVADITPADNPWLVGLKVHNLYLRHLQQPQDSHSDWLNLVRLSFEHQVLTTVTSYIVTENAAQMAALKQKQAQVLNAAKYLDIDESAEHMSEPPLLVLLCLFCVFLLRQRQRA